MQGAANSKRRGLRWPDGRRLRARDDHVAFVLTATGWVLTGAVCVVITMGWLTEIELHPSVQPILGLVAPVMLLVAHLRLDWLSRHGVPPPLSDEQRSGGA